MTGKYIALESCDSTVDYMALSSYYGRDSSATQPPPYAVEEAISERRRQMQEANQHSEGAAKGLPTRGGES